MLLIQVLPRHQSSTGQNFKEKVLAKVYLSSKFPSTCECVRATVSSSSTVITSVVRTARSGSTMQVGAREGLLWCVQGQVGDHVCVQESLVWLLNPKTVNHISLAASQAVSVVIQIRPRTTLQAVTESTYPRQDLRSAEVPSVPLNFFNLLQVCTQ